MKETVFIAIDCGKYATKGLMQYKGRKYTLLIRTKLQEVSKDTDVDIQPNSYKVIFEGKHYLLGDMVSEGNSSYVLTKEIIIHKLAIYTSIVELMKRAKLSFQNVELHVAINSPINVYKSKANKESYKKYIENNSTPILMKINDESSMFTLKDVTICFEGSGLVYAESNNFGSNHEKKTMTKVVIDIGGLNTTYCSYVNGIQPIFDSMVVSQLGINELKADLERKIKQTFNLTVSANDIEQCLKKGYLSHMGQVIEESKTLISDVKKIHFEAILNYSKQQGYTFTEDEISICGGGALLLRNEIESIFPNAKIVLNPQFANVSSFLGVLKVKYSA